MFNKFSMFFSLMVFNITSSSTEQTCPSVTTCSGTEAPPKFQQICSGQLIFEDNFDDFDLKIWEHENTLSGGGNKEFQWYTNNRSNSYVENGILYIRPTLTIDPIGGDDAYLYRGIVNLNNGDPGSQCTNSRNHGCQKPEGVMLNPIKSARIRTVKSFSFKYGTVEVRAKLPTGDWLWPAVWLLPRYQEYGLWPASGEIDLIESRGNSNLTLNGENIGENKVSHALHYTPTWTLSKSVSFATKNDQGFNKDFHRYRLEWKPDLIKFSVDDIPVGSCDGNFWQRGRFDTVAPNIDNPWRHGTQMAPFDKEFYLIINLAVGGGGYFPDLAQNPTRKPWVNNSPTAMKDFWDARSSWLPTWDLNQNYSKNASLQIDYIRVWAA